MKAWILDDSSRSVLKNLEVCSCCFIFDKFLFCLWIMVSPMPAQRLVSMMWTLKQVLPLQAVD